MAKTEVSITTRILISIIVVVAASITIINMLTIYGILETPDMLTYVIMIGVYTLPFVIIGATVNKIFREQKKAIEDVSKGTKDVGRKLELKINFKSWETIMADTTSHPAFYVKIAIASALSVSVGLLTYSIFSQHVLVGSLSTMIPAFAPLIAICVLIHLFSKHIFGPHGWRELLEHSWISLLVITFSISLMISLRLYITESYPRQFWERFLDFPFSLPTLMFFAIMLLFGGILIRLGDIIPFESSPLKASGTTFVLLSIAFLVPAFDILDWNLLLSIVSQLFSISLVIYGLAVAGLLYKDAGMRFLVTNDRVIKLDTNKLENSSYYPLEDMKTVEIVQDFLASTFDYGNVVITFKLKKGVKKSKAYCILYGVTNPELITNTIKAIADHKKTQLKPKKPVVKKDKPVKKKGVSEKKRPVNKKKIKRKKKDNFYYRIMVPVFMIVMIFGMVANVYAQSGEGATKLIYETHEIAYSSTSMLRLNTTLEIYAYTIEGSYLEAQDIREFAGHSVENADIVESVLENETRENLHRILDEGFSIMDSPDVNVTSSITLDSISLYGDLSENEPVVYHISTSVEFEPAFFELPDNADVNALFMGILKAGGTFEQDITLICEPGHHATYEFYAAADTVFGEGTDTLNFEIDNLDGTEMAYQDILLDIHHSSPEHIDETEMDVSLLIDLYALERGEAGEFMDINVNFSASISSMSVPDSLGRNIPEHLSLEYLDARSLRILYMNGLARPVNDFIHSIENLLNDQVSSWGDEAVVENIEKVNFELEDSDLPVLLYYNASVRNNIGQENEDLSAFIPREFTFSENVVIPLTGPSYMPVDITILIPEGLELIRARLSGNDLTIYTDESGRQYTTISLEPEDSKRLSLIIGTTVDIMDFLPFGILIGGLLVIWIGLNVYKIKRPRPKVKKRKK